MITIKDLDPKKYDPQKLGILKREDNGCGLFLFGSIINRQIRLTLKSEVQSRGETRRTYRQSWWNSESPIDKAGLTKIKAQAQDFYDRIKNSVTNNKSAITDYVPSWLDTYTEPNTKRYYESSIKKSYIQDFLLLDPVMIKLEDLQKIDCFIIGDEKSSKTYKLKIRRALLVLLKFVAYKTGNIELVKTLSLFRSLAEPIKVDRKPHMRTIPTKDNTEVRTKITECFYKAFRFVATNNKVEFNSKGAERIKAYPLILLKHFLIPVRPIENENMKRENITDSNIFIEKTKTLKEGYNVPITPAVRFAIDRDFPVWTNKWVETANFHRDVFQVLKLETSPHGIRAIFADYMTRENIPFYLVESCLSHVIHSEVANAYHRDAENFFYSQRREIMPKWYAMIFDCFHNALDRFLAWRLAYKNFYLKDLPNNIPIDLWQEIADKGTSEREK